ncbi:MAG: hypothetical protein LBL00_01025 [Endomicrobium sp.]|jgi:hypothetical protein|nr:hypothetical protein [Endomicrobium sp.]
MRILLAVLFSIVSVLPVFAADKQLVFDNYGFAIDRLSVTEKEDQANFQTILMFLPSDGVFAPNVNVQKQKFDASADDYIKLSMEQFESFGIKIIDSKKSDKFATFEYVSAMNGLDLHFYSKAVFSKGYVYLVTGTAAVSQWESVGKNLKKTVDSLKLLK